MTCSKEFTSPHNLVLTDKQVSNLRKTVVKKLLGVASFQKTQYW